MATRVHIQRPSVAYLLAPALAMVVVVPVLIEFKPGRVPWWFSNIPIWLGFLAAPGYVYAWGAPWGHHHVTRIVAGWVRVSLVVALVAAAWGTAFLALTGIFWVFPAITVALVLSLWVRFGREDVRHPRGSS